MSIKVPEKYVDLYLVALNEKKKSIIEKIESLKREIFEIDNHINNLTSMSIFDNSDKFIKSFAKMTYRKDWTWVKKIDFYQERKGKLMTCNEVVSYICAQESNLNRMKVRSSVSSALSNGARSGKYIKYIAPSSLLNYYAPSEWFDKFGKPLYEYYSDEMKESMM